MLTTKVELKKSIHEIQIKIVIQAWFVFLLTGGYGADSYWVLICMAY